MAFLILIVSLLAGPSSRVLFDFAAAALQIAGGLLTERTASRCSTRQKEHHQTRGRIRRAPTEDCRLRPAGTPLSGPGSMAVMINLATECSSGASGDFSLRPRGLCHFLFLASGIRVRLVR